MNCLSTGCKSLDTLMNGGFPLKAPSLIFGMPNLGKSIVGETLIPVSKDGKTWEHIPIKEIKKYGAKYCLSLNKELEVEITPILAFYELPVESSDRLVKVKVGGVEVIATDDHGFLTARKNSLVRVNAAEIDGEYTPLVPSLNLESKQQTFLGKEVNTEIAYMIGFYLAEGLVRKTGRISFFNTNLELLSRIKEILEKEMNLRTHLYKKKCPELTVYSRKIGKEWLEVFGTGENKRIPSWIYNLDLNCKKSLLKGYLDGDGYLQPDGTYEFVTKSKKLSEGLNILIHQLGWDVYFSNVKKVNGKKYFRTCFVEKNLRALVPLKGYDTSCLKGLNSRKDPIRRRKIASLRRAIKKGHTQVRFLKEISKYTKEFSNLEKLKWKKAQVCKTKRKDKYVYDISNINENFILSNCMVVHNTWLCFQASCMSTRSVENGGLDRPVLYLDTESFFASQEVFDRFYGYFRNRWKDLPVKARIDCEMVPDIFELGKKFGIEYTMIQEESRVSAIAKFPSKKQLEISKGKPVKETTQTSDWLKDSPIWKEMEKKNYGLIVIDSITVPIKSVIPKGTQHLPGRGTLLTSLLGTLYPIAKEFNAAIIVTDHITRNPMSPGYVYGVGDPWGGQDITYYIKYQYGLYGALKEEKDKYGPDGPRLRRVERHRYPGLEKEIVTILLAKDYGYTDLPKGSRPA